MANIEELLAAAGTEDMDDELSYVIDEHLRVIAVPERGVVLGVEGDKNVNRVRFAINRYYHGSDFSEFEIRIHYENAEGERNYFTVTEKTVEEDRMSFIWTVDADAVAYKGSVHFVVNCFIASEDGTVTKAYHTTLGTASVLEGLSVGKDTDSPEIVDLLTRLEHDLGVYVGTLIVQAENAAKNSDESRIAAANSAAAAKTSETNAASSAGKAASSATDAKASEMNAGTSAAAAKTSEANASASAGKAASSATAAKTSETNAASSASDAASSASAAEASETNAGTSATAAKASEANASASAGKAASSESAAKTSETKAANSAAAAKTSEANAEAYSKRAQTIANGYKGWYADESALNTAMPTGTNGDWAMVGTSGSMWVWDGEKSKWKCSAELDATLSQSGKAADAKAVGDALENVYGKTETYTKAEIDALLQNLNVCPFEVGDVLHTTSSVSPAARFGGTWEEIAADRVLMGASSSHAAGTTVEAGLPDITGSVGRFTSRYNGGPDRQQGAFDCSGATSNMGFYGSSGSYGYGTYLNFHASKSNAIYGASGTVQPAAYYVHIWQRIA